MRGPRPLLRLLVLLVVVVSLGLASFGSEKGAWAGGRGEKRLVLLVALPAAGKGTLGNILTRSAQARGWVSSDVVRAEVARRGLEPTPDVLFQVGKQMQDRDPGVVGRVIAGKIARSRGKRHFIDGLRTVADVVAVRAVFPGARLAKIDVDAELRYKWMLERARLGETSLEILRRRDAGDLELGVGKLLQMDSGEGESFLLRPDASLESLIAGARPVVQFLRSR